MGTLIKNYFQAFGYKLPIGVWVGIFVFIYTISVGMLIRVWVLPDLFPLMHGGYGFFAGGDSIFHHNSAIRLADEIRIHGWGIWSLKPAREPLVGLLAGVYVVFGNSFIPWLVMNSLAHAISAVLLFQMTKLVWPETRVAITAIVPFIFFPTAAYWYSQILKDGFYILGAFMFIYGALLIQIGNIGARKIMMAVMWMLSGLLVIFAIRGYALMIFSSFIGLLILRLLIVRWANNGKSEHGVAVTNNSCIVILAIIMLISVSHNFLNIPTTILGSITKLVEKQNYQQVYVSPDSCDIWQKTAWVPEPLDRLAYSLVSARKGYFWYDNASGSTMDREVCLTNFSAVLSYMPRALQLGLFAPFPSQWIESGMAAGSGTMRKLAGLEMTIVYISMIGVLLGALARWRSPEWQVMLMFSIYFLLLYGLVTPNIGALHRMRYGFLMIVVAMGVAELVTLWLRSRRQFVV